jgi:hypothetical protein
LINAIQGPKPRACVIRNFRQEGGANILSPGDIPAAPFGFGLNAEDKKALLAFRRAL